MATKLGKCPDILPGMLGICLHGCEDDESCPGDKKCCSNGCGQVCTVPESLEKKRSSLVYLATDEAWKLYKIKFNKNYTTEEEGDRRNKWAESVKGVNTHNEGYASGLHSWTQGVNKFSDGTRAWTGRVPLYRRVPFYIANNQTWNEYKTKFAKNYTNASDELNGRQMWADNIDLANKAGNNSFSMGIDQFSDEQLLVEKVYVASNETWEMYKSEFNKTYAISDELEKRKSWEASVASVNEHNEEYNAGNHSWTQGINQFSDGTLPAKGLLGQDRFLNEPVVYEASNQTWEGYKKKFNKNYTTVEEPEKRKSWEDSVASVNIHNEGYNNGTHSWYQGINAFSDGTAPGKGYLPKIASVALKGPIYLSDNQSWTEYKLKFKKSYPNEDEAMRRKAWQDSIKTVNAHNVEFEAGSHSYSKGVNQFSDGTRPFMGLIVNRDLKPYWQPAEKAPENQLVIDLEDEMDLEEIDSEEYDDEDFHFNGYDDSVEYYDEEDDE